MPKKIPESFEIEADLRWDDDSLKAAEGDGKGKKPTFNLVANTGKPMEVNGFFDPVVIDMAGAKFAKSKTPVLADHDVRLRIGHTTEQNIEPAKITVAGIVSSNSNVAKGFVDDARDGFPFQVSVGAKAMEAFFVPENEKATVNGRTFKGPLVVASKTRIREVSITVLGADGDTSAKVAATMKGSSMDFEAFVESLGLKASSLTDDQKAKLEAHYKQTQGKGTPATPPVKAAGDGASLDDHTAKKREVEAAEEERVDSIKAAFKRYADVDEVELEEGKSIKAASLKAKAIREGWDADKVELALLRASRVTVSSGSGGPAIHTGSADDADLQAKAIEINLCRQVGIPDSEQKNPFTGKRFDVEGFYTQKQLEASDDKRYRNPSLHQLIDLNLSLAGMEFHGNRKSKEYIKAYRQSQRTLLADGAGPFSTLAVTNLLENVANKRLLSAYMAQEAVWNMIAAIRTLSDFKTHSFYRLTINGGYVKVGADGQIGHGEFSDQKFQVQADTYGMILALTRQDIFNDDLNAFDAIPSAMGREAAIALEEAVLGLVIESATLFTSGNGNLITDDLDIDGLEAMEVNFGNRTFGNGKPLLTSPDRILVGVQDKNQAVDLFEKRNLVAVALSTGGTPTRDFQENRFVGKFRPIPSPYLNNTNLRKRDGSQFSGQDADQWFAFVNPSVLAAVNVGFVQGQTTPVIESDDSSFDTLGTQWRSYHDWGVGEGDPKAAMKSTGVGDAGSGS